MQSEDGVKTDSDDKSADKVEEEKEDFIGPLQFLVRHITWDHNDADYYQNRDNTMKILPETNKNNAMAHLLHYCKDRAKMCNPKSTKSNPSQKKRR